MILSNVHKGCCPFLLSGHIGGCNKTVPLLQLVTEPLLHLVLLGKLLGKEGDLMHHSQNKCHINMVLVTEEFLKRTEDLEKNIKSQIAWQRLQQITENRERLIPIIESIFF